MSPPLPEFGLPVGPFLNGRVALVTGSGRRLGRALALGLAGLGATVAVHYRTSAGEAAEVVALIQANGGQAAAFQADLLDEAACRALVQAVVARFGALHVLINNVGDYMERNILEVGPADWHAILGSNLHSTFYMCHHALPELRKQPYGRIINIGFAGCERPRASVNSTAYAIAKTGVLALTRSLAVALQAEPVTVNMVSPGVLEESVSHPPLHTVPKGRWGQPAEIGASVAYLLSSQANYVTGQQIEVAGGWLL